MAGPVRWPDRSAVPGGLPSRGGRRPRMYGIGFPEQVLDVFPGVRRVLPVCEGTGPGPDMSWRIMVTGRHGSLRFDSEPGDTRFQVLLPLTAPEPDDTPEEPA